MQYLSPSLPDVAVLVPMLLIYAVFFYEHDAAFLLPLLYDAETKFMHPI